MQISFRHITLLVSILVVILSFLFFGRSVFLYSALLLAGLLSATIAFIVVLIKDNIKGKLIWTFVVVISAGLEQLSEPFLIKCSYHYLVYRHEALFRKVNSIMASKNGEASFTKQPGKEDTVFTESEKKIMNKLMNEAGIYYISKDTSKIFYVTYGMLDVHLGVYYFFPDSTPSERFTHVKEQWYY